MIELHNADCLEVEWPQVDAIITDIPYGTTACKWDTIIPFEPMWAKIKRSLKPKGAFVTTASQPFTSLLVCSNLEWLKYEWIFDKVRGVGFQIAKYRPMMQHENILVFGEGKVTYNPVMTKREKIKRSKCYTPSSSSPLKYNDGEIRTYTEKYPTSILKYSNASQSNKLHPTQKPVALYEYLIRTYTNEGDTVLDFCMGSGTTGVACKNLNRNFIGIEKDAKYFEIAQERIENARSNV